MRLPVHGRYNPTEETAMITLRQYAPGEAIIRENEMGECAYIIEKGRVEITREKEASLPKKPAIAGCPKAASRWDTKPGTTARSRGPSPATE